MQQKNTSLSSRGLLPLSLFSLALALLLVSCGGGGGGGDTTKTFSLLSFFAGNPYGEGSIDGTGPAANFKNPHGAATDPNGNVYVADLDNHIIRKITPAGVVTTLAGTAGETGSADGTGATARFSSPRGVATDSSGNVYVSDTDNHTIRKITPAGVVSTFAGTAGATGSIDGTGTTASFNIPQGIATDASGNVYVGDYGNGIVRKINQAGVVTTLAGTAGVSGSTDATGVEASFSYLRSVATDALGNVYVADSGNGTIRKITREGVVTTLAGTAGVTGSADGTGAAAKFSDPQDIVSDAIGNVYVSDTGNHTIRKITPSGVVTTLAGTVGVSGSADGTGLAASFDQPHGLANDASGNVYVSDTGNHTIRKITRDGVVTTLAGTARASLSGSSDGIGAAASFDGPSGIATDASGNVYVADFLNNTIRKITPAGLVTTFAGKAGVKGSLDGIGAAASFSGPGGVATDASGNVFVADSFNNSIRKITPAGVVTGVAGTAGVIGLADGIGALASFAGPYGIATDASGNVYVSDVNNNTIRKITKEGVVTTLAGTAGVTGRADGIGAAASFDGPSGLATDVGGNVYVSDYYNNTIRKITPAGLVTTLAGTAGVKGSADGIGAAASFDGPDGIAFDASGNMYVADYFNNTIRKITPTGLVTTLAGTTGVASFKPGALPGVINGPLGIGISGSKIYITINNGIGVIN
jgi:sugar lactone lactonase YvrE